MKSLGSHIWSIIKDIYQVGKAILLDNLQVDHTFNVKQIGYNYDAATNKAVKSLSFENQHITCSNCYAFLNLGVEVHLNVTKQEINTLMVNVIGTANMSVSAAFQYSGDWSKSGTVTLANIKSKPIPFSVFGVPFFLELEAPIELGYDVDIRESTLLQAATTASGWLTYGVQYEKSTGLVPMSAHGFESSGVTTQMSQTENADASIYLLPSVVALIDGVGGPSFALRAGISASADSAKRACSTVGADIEAHTQFNLAALVGAKFDLELAGHTLIDKHYGPKPIYSLNRPLSSGCIAFDGHGHYRVVAGASLLPGNAWALDSLAITCPHLKGRSLGSQVLDFDVLTGQLSLGMQFNGVLPHGECTAQLVFAGKLDSAGRGTLALDSSHKASFESCASDLDRFQLPSSISVKADPSTLAIDQVFGCANVVLNA